MTRCNHGPSRFYRTSFSRLTIIGFPHNAPTELNDWYGKLCSAPETTVSCPINSNRCN